MFELINNLVIKFAAYLAPVLAILTMIIIGTPFYSEKGGISRVKKKIINKKRTVRIHLLLIFLALFIPSVIIAAFYFLISNFPNFFLAAFFILLGGEIYTWHNRHRWNFTKYYISLFVLGFLLLILEVILILF